MVNIERKLQHDWDLGSFLQEFRCNSEEELFEVLKKDFSRKTAKSYIARMKKNSLKNGNEITIQSEEVKNTDESLEKEIIQIQDEITIEEPIEMEPNEQVESKGWLSKIMDYFKKILK